MLKKEVKVGALYVAKVSGRLTAVRIEKQIRKNKQGWRATNMRTGREIRILSGAKLRRELSEDQVQKVMEIYNGT